MRRKASPLSETRLRLDDQLCFSLYAATNAVTRAYRPLLAEVGLTYPQYLVMLALWQDGASTIGTLARRLNLPPNALTPLLARMEEGGLVSRRRDRRDRRVVRVEPTERGRAIRDRVSRVQEAVTCRTGLCDSELSALRKELHALARRIESAGERAEERAADAALT